MHDACNYLCKVITKLRQDTGTVVEFIMMEDFDQHNQLWREDNMFLERQSKTDPIITL